MEIDLESPSMDIDSSQHGSMLTNVELPRRKKKRIIFIVFSLTFFGILATTSEIATLCNIAVSMKHLKNETKFTFIQIPPTTTPHMEGSVELSPPNGTLCVKFKQFKLSNQKRLTVCEYNGIRVDFRRFIGHHPSIQGVWLTLKEWNNLVMYFARIQKTVIDFS